MTAGPAALRAASRPALLLWPAAAWLAVCCAIAMVFVSAPALAAGNGSTAATATGDPQRGAREYEQRCTGCHSVAENRVGPAHRGVFGRRAGMAPGFYYSPAVAQSRLRWTEANLDAWLKDPQALVPGQKMFVQVDDAAVRADLVAYLKTLGSAAAVTGPSGSPAAAR